jgi:hypothetical protein
MSGASLVGCILSIIGWLFSTVQYPAGSFAVCAGAETNNPKNKSTTRKLFIIFILSLTA